QSTLRLVTASSLASHPMTTKLGTDLILDALAAEGLGHLFMVPGGLIDPFLAALARHQKIKPIVAAHEGGAVYMADGYARAHGALVGETAADYVPVSGFFAQARELSTPAARAALKLIAEQVGGKSRIAILAGAGVEHDTAAACLREIAERWSIPVATTLRAKGVFPEDHALSLGVFGYAGSRHATAAILGGELDCLLVLGSGFNERDTMHWTVRERSKAFIIHVNTNMDELTANGDLGHVVPGSCHAFLDLMDQRAGLIGPALQDGQARRRQWLATIKAGPRLYDLENLSRTTAPIHPATAIAALRKALP